MPFDGTLDGDVSSYINCTLFFKSPPVVLSFISKQNCCLSLHLYCKSLHLFYKLSLTIRWGHFLLWNCPCLLLIFCCLHTWKHHEQRLNCSKTVLVLTVKNISQPLRNLQFAVLKFERIFIKHNNNNKFFFQLSLLLSDLDAPCSTGGSSSSYSGLASQSSSSSSPAASLASSSNCFPYQVRI